MNLLVKLLIAGLLPPLSVYLNKGIGGVFWLNILLTIVGYVPGMLHAVYLTFTTHNSPAVPS
ncbi:YqaE/Pmp3 family membrane protein [Alteromonas lipolytica]|uniref:Proteolipid membrane potential modulator n=1 Tax=Alteromonas lipolytica TaxID=1856405 RepID=A0A1E8FGK6_9ALTE|nr:YqaE/Pmp3 family membrane protein [Alteromonas lipolytica]OFI35044.1 proteolipid membrane potential modulator [Alteromonas lipolytica]